MADTTSGGPPTPEPAMPPSRVALVTGSGKRRVGRTVADAFAARGWRLVLHYRSSAADAADAVAAYRAAGVDALALGADLADEAAVERMVADAVAHFGQLDAVVCCAAIWERKRLEDVRAADVRAHFEVNVLGTFLCARAGGLAMVRQPEGGCVITVGDWAEVRPYPDYAAYFATKGG